MPESGSQLPSGLQQWVCEVGAGDIVRLQRHVARREAWIVDIKRADGSMLEGFLRLQRPTQQEQDPLRLLRDAQIMNSLHERGFPAPRLLAWSEEHRAALLSRDPGRSDIDHLDSSQQQRAIMEDFMTVIARIHCLDPDSFDLQSLGLKRPDTDRETVLGEVDATVQQWQGFLDNHRDPLTHYALSWLQRYAPKKVQRMSLVQGDTGPVNFMFQGNRVSSVVDWECAHYGDPLEDLGNIVVREFWNPCGGLAGLFKLYEQHSGIRYDRFLTQYYAVHQNVRGMIPIHAVCEFAPQGESLGWYLCYRYVGDRATAEMLAMAMGLSVTPPELPAEPERCSPLATAAGRALQQSLRPEINDSFALSQLDDTAVLIECMDRIQRFGAELEDAQRSDLATLPTIKLAPLAHMRAAVCDGIESDLFSDSELLPLLARQAYRDEWLYKPVSRLYPDRHWSELD